MAEPDSLFTLRNEFWVGNFNGALSEGLQLYDLPEHINTEKDTYVYRSYIGLGQLSVVVDEIREDSRTPVAVLAVKDLATYMLGNSTDSVLARLNNLLSQPTNNKNTTLRIVLGIIHMHEGLYSQAIQILRESPSMEMRALTVQAFLKMDRIDLAESQLATMQHIEDDCTLTLLATAWVHLARDDQKCQESIYLFQELADRFGTTVMLLNGMAVCDIQLKNFVEAEKRLIDAYGKNSSDPDTLINLIIVSQHLHKPTEQIEGYIRQLREAAPSHVWLEKYKHLESSFDRIASAYA